MTQDERSRLDIHRALVDKVNIEIRLKSPSSELAGYYESCASFVDERRRRRAATSNSGYLIDVWISGLHADLVYRKRVPIVDGGLVNDVEVTRKCDLATVDQRGPIRQERGDAGNSQRGPRTYGEL